MAPKGKKSEADSFLTVLRKQFLPNRIITVATEGKDLESQAKLIPFVRGKLALEGKTTAYVCEEGMCKLPTTDPTVFARQIKAVKKLTVASDKSDGT